MILTSVCVCAVETCTGLLCEVNSSTIVIVFMEIYKPGGTLAVFLTSELDFTQPALIVNSEYKQNKKLD